MLPPTVTTALPPPNGPVGGRSRTCGSGGSPLVSWPQDARLLSGELLLGEDSTLLEGCQLLQLGDRIGRGRGLPRPCPLRLSLLRLGLTARQPHHDCLPRRPADQTRTAISHKWTEQHGWFLLNGRLGAPSGGRGG